MKTAAKRPVKLDLRKLMLEAALRMLNARRTDDGACLALRDFFKQGGWLLRRGARGGARGEILEMRGELRPSCGDVRAIRILPSGIVEIFDEVPRAETERPLVTARLDEEERMRLREILREGAPEGEAESPPSSGRRAGGPSPGDLEVLDWVGRVSAQISVLMNSRRSEERSLGKMLYQSLQVLNRLARRPPPSDAHPLYLEPEEVASDLEKKKWIPSADPGAPWWMKKSRYELFRRHSRELILRASRREEEGLRSSDSDARLVDAVRLMAGEPEVRMRAMTREKDPARRFAAQLALAIGRRETLGEIDGWYGGLSTLGLHLEQKLGLV